MRLVVIGGAGFLGRALIAALPADVNAISFDRAEADVVGDALDPAAVAPVVRDADAVWIRAGILGGTASTDVANAEAYMRNVEIVRNVLDACGSCRAVFFDSSEQVFGTSADTFPNDVSLEPMAMNFYGASKAISEKLLQRWALADERRSVQIFRYSRVHSATARDVIHAMAECALAGVPFRFTVDPARRISFVHIDDVVAANLAALSLRPRCAIYQVSCDRPYSLEEIARLAGVVRTTTETVVQLPFEPFVAGMRWEESARALGVQPRWDVPSMVAEAVSRAAARRP